MKILFIHEVGYEEKPVFEMHEFPEALSTRGHPVAFLDYPELRSGMQSEKQRRLTGRVIEGSEMLLFSQASLFPGTFGRLIASLLFPRLFKQVIKSFDPDIVVCLSVPTSGWQALIICRRRGIPFVFRALDVSHKIRRTVFSPAIRAVEKFIYSRANWVSCNNEALAEYCSEMGAKSERLSVQLPPLKLEHFELSSDLRTKTRRHLGIPEKAPTVIYMGSFFYFSGLDRVLESLSTLPEKPFLVLIGGGEQDAYLRQLVQKLNLEGNVIFTGFVSFADLPSYLAAGDVAINPMYRSLVSNAALPNKVLQYMAMGLPVVTTALSGLQSLFPNESGLKIVSKPEEIMEGAIRLIAREDLKALGQSNRETVLETFSSKNAVDEFESLLYRVLDSK